MSNEAERDANLSAVLDQARSEYLAQGEVSATTSMSAIKLDGEAENMFSTLRDLDDAVRVWCNRWSPADCAQPELMPLPERIGRYPITAWLGEGGMGTVYRGFDPDLERPVAIKVPRLSKLDFQRDVQQQRFLREAKAIAAVRHSNVCPIYDVGETNHTPFVVMAFLEGETLSQRLQRVGRLPWREAVNMSLQITAALEAVHSRGIVHRDVKPGNIMLDPAGRAILMDFGLARPEGLSEVPGPDSLPPDRKTDDTLTSQGTIVGTPAYMAPEQARGEKVDPSADLFSLGCVLYRAVTGKPPFAGSDVASMLAAVNRHQPPAPRKLNAKIPAALDAIIRRLLNKDRAQRPSSAAALQAELRGLERASRPRWWAVGLAAAAVVALLLFVFFPDKQRPTPASPARSDIALPYLASPVFYPVGRLPFAVILDDFDGDQLVEMVVSNIESNSLTFYRGDGKGGFGARREIVVPGAPHALVSGDFNGDAIKDVVVTCLNTNKIALLRGKGDGTFAGPIEYGPTGKHPRGIAAGDLNGDGLLDLVTANVHETASGSGLSVFLAQRDASFAPPVQISGPHTPCSVALGDINGDQYLDAVTSNMSANTVSVLVGDGTGALIPKAEYPVGSGPGIVVLADFNGDRQLDIAIENFGNYDVHVLLGQGDGTFRTGVPYSVGQGPGGLAAADVNGDDILDLIVANHASHNVSVLAGKGDGTFRPALHFATGGVPALIAARDLDGDGRIDFAVVNHRTHDVAVLLNRPPQPSFRLTTPVNLATKSELIYTITAVDAQNQIQSDFEGDVNITVDGDSSVEKKIIHFSKDQRGVANVNMLFPKRGYWAVRITDVADPRRTLAMTLEIHSKD